MTTELYPIAWKLHSLGYTVLPSGGGSKGKAPLVQWEQYQALQPTDEQMHSWVDHYRPSLWGIVTGTKVVVFDADSPEAARPFENAKLRPHVRSPRGGSHFYFRSPGFPVKTMVGVLPGLDVRAMGGFCNIVGGNGTGEYHIEILPEPDSLYCWDQLPPEVAAALLPRTQENRESTPIAAIAEGARNATLVSLAGTMRRRGMTNAAIQAALLETNRTQCQPPLPEGEVRGIAASVGRYAPASGGDTNTGNNVHTCIYESDKSESCSTRTKLGQELGHPLANTRTSTPEIGQGQDELGQGQDMVGCIRGWVSTTTGWFSTDELDKDLGIITLKQKDYRGKVLRRLKDEGIVEQHPKQNRQWRFINTRVTSLAFKTAATAGVLPVRWPLSIEKYVNLFPSNLAVVAGSPNAGKTALLLDFIRLNQKQFPIYYHCSEMGPVELRNRLEQFPDMAIEDWHFEALERSSDFADVIRPDCVNIIDYLEMTTELFQVNAHLTAISHKIGSGLAIVALQKKQGATYGRGQEFGLEKPKLYLSMDEGRLTVVKGKAWAQRGMNPNGLRCSFKITGGCQFEMTKPWGASRD